MEPLNVECDLQSLRRLYGLLLNQSNANKEYVPQAFLLDENSQFLLKRLLDAATKELMSRQHKVLAQAQLGLQERVVSTRSNSVSRGIVKLPSKVGLTKEVVDSMERIETQLSAFEFYSTRGDHRTRSCKSPSEEEEEEDYSSSVMEPRQSYLMSQTRRTSKKIAPSLRSLNNSRYDHPALVLQSQGSSSHDDQIVLATSRPPLPPPRPMRSVGFEKLRQSNRISQKMASMKPTLLLDQGTETGTSSEEEEEEEEQVSSTDRESGETVTTSGSSWETHSESVTESDSSETEGDDENSQVSDSPPRKRRDRSRDPSKQRKRKTGRLKRFKEKLGKVFHHHHYHHHQHHNKEEDQGRKPPAWKHLVKKHLQKDKEKLVEDKRMKTEPKGLTTHNNNNNKGGQFHALVKGFMKHHSKNKKKQKMHTPKRQGGVKIPKRGRVKLEKTNYLCNKDQEHDEILS